MNSRKARLPEIIDILTHQEISSQEELSKLLAVRGHIITQATLSRDLKLLKATKVSDSKGSFRYVIEDRQELPGRHAIKSRSAFHSTQHTAVLSVTLSSNMIVIKTRNGYASGLAYDIDMLNSDLILGTIPGADTVFAVARENAPADELYNLLTTFLPATVMETARPYFQPREQASEKGDD